MHADAEFLAAVLAAPDDDTPRLVYADWLEENAGTVPCPECEGLGPEPGHIFWSVTNSGEFDKTLPCKACRGTGRVPDGRALRAEFIRVQCEVAQLEDPAPPGVTADAPFPGRRLADLHRREGELWAARPFDWFGLPTWQWFIALHNDETASPPYGIVRRGFLEHVACSAADWLAHGPAVVACQPVREVRLTGAKPVVNSYGQGCLGNADVYGAGPSMIPGPIFRLLPDDGPLSAGDTTFRSFADPGRALAALSAACLAWARRPRPKERDLRYPVPDISP